MRPASKAWIGLAAGVAAYDILCPPGEMMSEGVDRGLEQHKLLTIAAVGATALHLLNVLPDQADPFKMICQVRRFRHA